MDAIKKEQLINKLGENLPFIRKKIGITQEELGNRIHVSRITINTIERTKKMSWGRFTSILMVLTSYKDGCRLLESLGVYDPELEQLFKTHISQSSPNEKNKAAFIGAKLGLVGQFAEFLPSAFFVFDEDRGGEMMYFNTALLEIVNETDRNEFIRHVNNKFRTFIYKDDLKNFDSLINEKKNFTLSHRIVTKDNKIKWVTTNIRFAEIEGLGKISLGFTFDITEQYSRRMSTQVSRIEEANKEELIKGLDEVEATSLLKRSVEGLKVLLADGNIATLEIERRLLELEGAIVTSVTNGKQAVSAAKRGNFDLVLIDLVLPIINGVEAIRQISEIYKRKDVEIPILGMTFEESDYQIKDAINAGAFECLYRPLSIPELSSIILSFTRKAESTMKIELKNAVKNANTDALTKVKSASAYSQRVSEINREIRSSGSVDVGIVLCDCDNLKTVNDTFGHSVGDTYIKNCCKIICETFSHSPVFRIGGDEFLVILQNKDLKESQYLLKKFEMVSNDTRRIGRVEDGKASISMGYALFDRRIDKDIADTCRRADAEMYKIKNIHHSDGMEF